MLEFIRLGSYLKPDYQFTFLLTAGDVEIDLVIERPGQQLLCIEIKSSDTVNQADISSFIQITKDLSDYEAIVLIQDPFIKKFDHVTCYPWKQGIEFCFPELASEIF